MAQDGIQKWGLVNMVMNLLQRNLKVEAAGLLHNIGVYLSDLAASHSTILSSANCLITLWDSVIIC